MGLADEIEDLVALFDVVLSTASLSVPAQTAEQVAAQARCVAVHAPLPTEDLAKVVTTALDAAREAGTGNATFRGLILPATAALRVLGERALGGDAEAQQVIVTVAGSSHSTQ
jgi:hypothetical protein